MRVAILRKEVVSQRTRKKNKCLTNIAPDGSPVHEVIVPYYGVDKLVKTSGRCPYHKETGARIPSLEMPWQGYQHDNEAYEREDRIEGVCRIHEGRCELV